MIYSSVKIPYLAPLYLLYPAPFRQSLACYPTGYKPGADEFPTRRITGYILVSKGIVRARQMATLNDTVNLAGDSMTRSQDQLSKVSAKEGTVRPHRCLGIVDRQPRLLLRREDRLPRYPDPISEECCFILSSTTCGRACPGSWAIPERGG